MRAAEEKVENAAKSARDTAQNELRVLHLRSEDIKDELARTGQVVRRKAREAGQAIADATADARTTAAIKSKAGRQPRSLRAQYFGEYHRRRGDAVRRSFIARPHRQSHAAGDGHPGRARSGVNLASNPQASLTFARSPAIHELPAF